MYLLFLIFFSGEINACYWVPSLRKQETTAAEAAAAEQEAAAASVDRRISRAHDEY